MATKAELLQDHPIETESNPSITDSNENPTTAFITDAGHTQNIAMTTTTNFTTIEIDTQSTISYSNITNFEPDTPQSAPSVLTTDGSQENSPSPLPLSRTRSLSNKLNRSAPVLFLKNHAGKMVGKKSPLECDRGPEWTNWVVGLSCACFIMPSITILILQAWNVNRMCIIFDCVYFVIVAICSFLSDYVYCYHPDPPLSFVTIDQWTATGGVLCVIFVILINPFPLILRVMNFVILLVALWFIGKSRKACSAKQWRKWHCIWHLFSGIGLSYIYTQEYLMRLGVIPSHDFLWPFDDFR